MTPLMLFYVIFIHQLPDELAGSYFQQDEATAHTAYATLNYLRQFFEDRIISRGAAIPWPTRSPLRSTSLYLDI